MEASIIFGIGLVIGGALSYLYASAVISDYKKAASAVGLEFKKAAGVLALIKKAL